MENSNQRFTELEVWKKARQLKINIREVTDCLPTDEKFRLADQLLRASRSVGTCIAEGHGRFTYKDQLHFCVMARGSLSEILNHLIDCLDEKYIDNDLLQQLSAQVREVERILNGYITWLRKQSK
ncbi:MAG: four helix bundle protein [Chitinophagaceae bacterium]|nr:MAG: four helix bundle protein [Chitinophagaceae bacterium]